MKAIATYNIKALATIKCPFCIGSINNNRKTLYLYSTDTYWCARCKAYGVTSELDPSLMQGITPNSTRQVELAKFEYNNAGERFSVCKHRYSDSNKDVFQIKLPDGSLVGHYYRYKGKESKIEGIKGLGYREKFMQLGETYRLVEGPYDCIYPNDVCLFGYPTTFQRNSLIWYDKLGKLILCPDGDVWKAKETLKRWLEPFALFKNTVVEYIPAFRDPDECPQDDRTLIEYKKVFDWCKG